MAAVRGRVVLPTPGSTPATTEPAPAIGGDRFVDDAATSVLLDDPSALVLPALANGHDHGRALSSLASGVPDSSLETWLPAVRALPDLEPEAAAIVFHADLLRSGITAAMHLARPAAPEQLLETLPLVARGATATGSAIAIAVPLQDQGHLLYGHGDSAIAALTGCGYKGDPRAWLPAAVSSPEECIALVEEVASIIDDPRVTVQLGPLGPQWASDELLAAIADASARTGRRVHMHLLESRRQRAYLDDRHAEGVVRHLDRLGLLSERLSVAHGVWLRPDELELLAERGVTIVVNVSSNLRLRSGVAPVALMGQSGVRVAAGLDGTTLDDDLDGLRELRLFHLLNVGVDMVDAVPRADVFQAAMDHAHFAIRGEPGPWSFAPDRPADLVLLDAERLLDDVSASVDPAVAVLARASRAHVKHVIAGGKVVVRDGQLVTVDIEPALAVLLGQLHASHDLVADRACDLVDLKRAVGTYYSSRPRP